MRSATQAISLSGIGTRSLAVALLMIAGIEIPTAIADVSVTASDRTPTVLVTARKHPTFDAAEDAETTVRVTAALHDDPFLLDDHMSVSTIDGVVYLDGFIDDDWDLSRVLRLARRLAGGRRIINRLEFARGGTD